MYAPSLYSKLPLTDLISYTKLSSNFRRATLLTGNMALNLKGNSLSGFHTRKSLPCHHFVWILVADKPTHRGGSTVLIISVSTALLYSLILTQEECIAITATATHSFLTPFVIRILLLVVILLSLHNII